MSKETPAEPPLAHNKHPEEFPVIRPPSLMWGSLAVCVGANLVRPTHVLAALGVPPAVRRLVGITGVASGVALMGVSHSEFTSHKTAVPHALRTTCVVSSGPYALSRNPIYLGMGLIWAGVAVWADNAYMALTAPVIALVMHYGVVRREEHFMTRVFGEEYAAYTRRVARYVLV